MPTFRNGTKKWVDAEAVVPGRGRVLVRFAPKETRALGFWVDYEAKGLTLVDANDPPVPPRVLASGTFAFAAGEERRFAIPRCGRYAVDLIVQEGRVKLYAGTDPVGAEVVKDDVVPFRYRQTFDWERAPFLRVVGVTESRATLHAEAETPCRVPVGLEDLSQCR